MKRKKKTVSRKRVSRKEKVAQTPTPPEPMVSIVPVASELNLDAPSVAEKTLQNSPQESSSETEPRQATPQTPTTPDTTLEVTPSASQTESQPEAKTPPSTADLSSKSQPGQEDSQSPVKNVSSQGSEPAETSLTEDVEEIHQFKWRKTLFVLGLGFTLGIIVASGAIFLFWRSQPVTQEQVAVTFEKTSPRPSPTFDPSLWVLEVLNGSGVAGAAGKAAEELKTKGYLVERTGNAVSRDFPQTLIYVSDEKSKEIDLLLEDLRLTFSSATLSGTFESDEDSTTTARIVIGKK